MLDERLLCINQVTLLQQWSLEQLIDGLARHKVGAISVWRDKLHECGVAEAARMLKGQGLVVTSLCAAGLLTSPEPAEAARAAAARMASEASRQLYNQRPHIAETTFGILKAVMGFRQFLLRGLEKVKTEWLWAATAFNLMKLSRALGQLRAECSKLAARAQN